MVKTIENAFLSYGEKNAAVQVEVFLNLACPYCATWFEIANQQLTPYMEEGKVHYVIKHYDKPREMLLYGTLVNLHLDYSQPERIYEIMKELFAKQSEWSESDSDSIKKLLVEEYGLKEEAATIDLSLKITDEAIKRQVKMVPTVYINEKEFQFPIELSAAQLKEEVEKELAYV